MLIASNTIKQKDTDTYHMFELNIANMTFKLSPSLFPDSWVSKHVFKKFWKHFGTTLRQLFHLNPLSLKLYF